MPAKVYIRLYRGLIAVLLTSLVAVIVMVMSAYYIFTHKPLPQVQGALAVKGLEAPVTITRDRWGVPHIVAESARDAFFGAGYAQAQDRLFQMDHRRRAAGGRLSEWMGREALAGDKLARTIGVSRQASKILEALPPESREVLEAFAAGVNAYAQGRLTNLPVEYKALRTPFAPWRAEDSIAIAIHQAWGLSGNWRMELLRLMVAGERGLDEMWKLLPPYAGEGPYIIDAPAGVAAPEDPDQGARLQPDLLPLAPAGALALIEADRQWRRANSPYASNAWALDGSWSASGLPMLANDPHLALESPSAWYEMHLAAPGFEVTGATLPGLPVVIIGHSREAAWASTSSTADVADLFIEELDPADPGRYRFRGESLAFERVTERALVRAEGGVMREEAVEVRISRHGPALPGLAADDGRLLCLKWSGLERFDPIAPFLAAARSRDFASFRAGIGRLGCPSMVWLFAGRSGEIGLVTTGLVPVRPLTDGSFPVPGTAGDHDWQGYRPRDELPWQVNPPSGFLVAANNRVASPNAGFPFLSADWAPPYRAQRIALMLEARQGQKLTARDLALMQLDAVSLRAQRLKPILLGVLGSEPDNELFDRAARQLADWDGTMAADGSAPTIFAEVYDRAYRLTYEDEMSAQALDLFLSLPPAADFDRLLEEGTGPVFDVRSTPEIETRDEVLREAFRRGLLALERTGGPRMSTWSWGRFHALDLAHPFSDRLERRMGAVYFGVNQDVLALDGGRDTVNSASWVLGSGFRVRWGSSLRTTLDWGALDEAWMSYPGGQSGQPFSPHYADLLKLWHNGSGHPMLMDQASIEASREARLELVPGGGEGGVDAP